MKAAFGKVTDVRAYASRLLIEIPVEHHVAATDLLYGHDVLVTIAPDVMKGTPYGVRDSEGENDVNEASASRPEATESLAPDAVVADSRDGGERPATHGGLTQLAGRWCKEPIFQGWLAENFEPEWASSTPLPDAEHAAAIVRRICKIESRRELDTNPDAALRFEGYIRKPFREYLDQQEQAT
jgi:hypothetical protein